MSVRPPTLREKRRYILARIEPCGLAVEGKDLYFALHESVTSLWGDILTAAMAPAVIAIEDGHAIIRCRRGTERECVIAIGTLSACRDHRIALRIVAISGTIESLRDRIKSKGTGSKEIPGVGSSEVEPGTGEPSEYFLDSRECTVLYCNGQKIDVIEKGFKNTNRMFLTRADLEKK